MTPHDALALTSIPLMRRNSARLKILRGGIVLGLLIFGIVSLPASARAWGCEGHQVVALLAEKHLTAHALAKTKQILAEGPIDPGLSRFCKEGGIDAMSDASSWADDIRSQRPETAPWHYIDIPLGTTQRDVEKYCDPKESCVTSAITDQLAILRSANSDPRKRAEALRFLIHFVGDVHQPLHATTNNDEGGNCVPVAFFDLLPQLRNPQTGSYAPNLHSVWDVNILEKATTGKTVDQVANDIDRAFRRKIAGWKKSPSDVDSWAWESYELAVKKAYGKLPVRVSVEAPQPVMSCTDDNHISARMLKLNEQLVDPYQDMAVPTVRERLAEAGARLASMLNQLWP